MRTLRVELNLRTALLAVGTVAAVWLALQLWPIVLVVVCALMIVGMLNPLAAILERRGMKRTPAVAIVWVSAVVIAGGLAALTFPRLVSQVADMVDRLPQLQQDLSKTLERVPLLAPLGRQIEHARTAEILEGALKGLLAYSPRALELGAYAVSAVFLALYFMFDRDRMRGALFAIVPREHHVKLSSVLIKLETIVGGYMRGQLITSLLYGVFTFAVLTIAGVPNAIALAIFAALADVLPYVGALLSCGPAFLAALQKGPTTALIVLVILAVYQEFESRVIVPRVYGRVLRLPAATVMLSLLIGGKLLGILGALLALPVAAAIRMLVYELHVDLPGEETSDDAKIVAERKAKADFEARAAGAPAIQAAAIATEIAEKELCAKERAQPPEPPPSRPPTLRRRTT